MNLELRKIKYSKFASEETHCYEAELFLDGKKIAVVSNQGHGGCDSQHFINREVETKVNEYFKSLPKESAYGMEFEQSLEGFCGDQVNNFLMIKDLQRLLKKKNTLIISSERGIFTKCFKATTQLPLELMIKNAKIKENEVILNSLDFDKALELYKTAAV